MLYIARKEGKQCNEELEKEERVGFGVDGELKGFLLPMLPFVSCNATNNK
jgi:hypothetical protein